jgi:hypothetical protein
MDNRWNMWVLRPNAVDLDFDPGRGGRARGQEGPEQLTKRRASECFSKE